LLPFLNKFRIFHLFFDIVVRGFKIVNVHFHVLDLFLTNQAEIGPGW
jgi:hypothetical protein